MKMQVLQPYESIISRGGAAVWKKSLANQAKSKLLARRGLGWAASIGGCNISVITVGENSATEPMEVVSLWSTHV